MPYGEAGLEALLVKNEKCNRKIIPKETDLESRKEGRTMENLFQKVSDRVRKEANLCESLRISLKGYACMQILNCCAVLLTICSAML